MFGQPATAVAVGVEPLCHFEQVTRGVPPGGSFRFSRALPPGARTRPPRRFRGIPVRAGPCHERGHLFAYAVTLASLYDYAKNAFKLNSRQPAGKVFPHEIGIQETHTKHRKLDSQTTLSHRARGRAPDGLRPQAWPLRPSRCDHDPGGLSPWSAGLRGLRPAMAADRAIRGPPARSPGQERNPQCAPNPG